MAEIRREDPRIRVNSDWADFQRDMRRNIELVNDLERATRGISANIGNIGGTGNTTQIRNTARALDSASTAAARANREFNLLRATAASLAGNVGSNLVFGLQDAIVNTIRLGVEMERVTTRFVAFSDTAADGRRQLADLANVADRLGVAFRPLIELATSFRAAGFEATEATDLIERLTIAAGGSAQAVDSISRSLRQIKTGKVELEELNPIAEAGIPIFQLLADQIGVTTRELRDLIRTGDVRQSDFFEAFRTFTDEGGAAAAAAAETADTISGSVNRIQTAFENLGLAIVEKFNTPIQEGLGLIQQLIDRATDIVSDPSPVEQFQRDVTDSQGLLERYYNYVFNTFWKGTLDQILNLNKVTQESIEETLDYTQTRLDKGINYPFGLVGGENLEEAIENLEKLNGLLELQQNILQSYEDAGIPEWLINTSIANRVANAVQRAIGDQKVYIGGLRLILQATQETATATQTYIDEIQKLLPLETTLSGLQNKRAEELEVLDKQRELGLVNQIEYKEKLKQLDEELLTGLGLLLDETNEAFDKNISIFSTIDRLRATLTPPELADFNTYLEGLKIPPDLLEQYKNFRAEIQGIIDDLNQTETINVNAGLFSDAWLVNMRKGIEYQDDWLTNLGISREIQEEIATIYAPQLVEYTSELRDIEETRLERIKEINAQVASGTLTQIEGQERIKGLNEEAINANSIILERVKEYYGLLTDHELQRFWGEFYKNAVEGNEELLELVREITRELANQGDEEINRLTLNRLIKNESQRRYEIEQGIGGELSEQIDALSIYEVALRRLNNLRVESDFASRFQSESQTDDASGGTAIRDKPNPFDLDFLKFGDNPFQDFLDSNLFEEIERLASNLGSVFSSIGEIIRNGANAELARMEKHLDELVAKNRELAEDINAQYELDRQDLEDNLESNLEAIEEERDELVDKYEVERSEGKLTAQQLADAKKKADQDYQKQVKAIRKENEDAQAELARKRTTELERLKNEENKVRNQINEHKWRADIENFHFQQGIRLAQVAYETALAVVRSFPNPFAIGGAVAAGVFATGAILSARPPEKPTPIPVFGDGGYVDSPTLAIVGDKGGELMIPERFIGRMGNTYIHQTVEGDVIREEDTGDYIIDIFKRARKNRIGIS